MGLLLISKLIATFVCFRLLRTFNEAEEAAIFKVDDDETRLFGYDQMNCF